jgi:hypothetical protein
MSMLSLSAIAMASRRVNICVLSAFSAGLACLSPLKPMDLGRMTGLRSCTMELDGLSLANAVAIARADSASARRISMTWTK